MTIALATKLANAGPALGGPLVPLTISSDLPTCTHVRLSVTNAPDGSALAKALEGKAGELARRQTLVTPEGNWKLTEPATHGLQLDRSGIYTFAAQELEVTEFGGSYDGDPLGDQTPTVLASSTVTLEVAERLTMSLGAPGAGATLVVWMAGGVVVETNEIGHGEATPAIISPQGQSGLRAAGAADVLTALDALVGYDVAHASTGLAAELEALSDALRTRLPAHFSSATFHSSADTDNDSAVENLPDAPATPDSWARFASVCAEALRSHMTNNAPGEYPWGVKRYHSTGGAALPDVDNQIFLPPGSYSPAAMAGACAIFAGLHRTYELHRLDSSVHASQDNDALPTLGALLSLHSEFLGAAADGTAPATMSAGQAVARTVAGFAPSPQR